MNLTFLCPTHREELKSKPHRALCGWANTNETGINLAEHGLHYDALPHLGSAFEIADIILNQNTIEAEKAASLFTKSALSLALSLNILGYTSQKNAVLQLAIQRLNQHLFAKDFKSKQIHMLVHSLMSTHTQH